MNREAGTSGGASRIGVEIGGTFTDLVWADGEGRLHTGKTPSTPAAIHEAVLTVIGEAGLPLEQAGGITHGSTVATNALITRKGAAVGLLTTAGFRDVVIVGRGDRDHGIYDMQYRRNPPPIRRSMIGEVLERMGADGHVIVPLDLEAAWRETEVLLEKGAAAIAVSLLHAYRNPAHEKAVAQMIQLLWTLLVSLPRADVLLVQTPPAIPALAAAWLVRLLRGTTVVVDWHNLAFTVMQQSLSARHPFIPVARLYERMCARAAIASHPA